MTTAPAAVADPGGRVTLPAGRVPPGPSRWRTLPLLHRLVADRLALLQGAVSEYGDAVVLRIGPKTLYVFNHPDHARHVLTDNWENYRKGLGLVHARRALGDGLLTSEGELWRRQRATVQPAFQARRIARQTPVIVDEATALVRRLRERAGGPPVDVLSEVTDLTMGVLGRTLLDTDLDDLDGIAHAFEAVQDQAMFEMVTLNAVPAWLPLPGQVRFRRARAQLQGVVDELVARRSQDDPAGRDDVLSRLVVATRDEPDARLAERRRRDELVTLLLAGHETTASTLGWALLLLDRHPEAFDRLHEEVVRVLGDRDPVHEDLRRLPFTTSVVEETMRLYPPVWILPRTAQRADTVGGYRVPAGADVLVSPYTLHRHPAFWDDPARFDPGRFAAVGARDRPRYAYLPFGAGPRFCVGNSLGMAEAVLALALLCRELRLRVVPGQRARPQPMLSLRLGGGLLVDVHLVP